MDHLVLLEEWKECKQKCKPKDRTFLLSFFNWGFNLVE